MKKLIARKTGRKKKQEINKEKTKQNKKKQKKQKQNVIAYNCTKQVALTGYEEMHCKKERKKYAKE